MTPRDTTTGKVLEDMVLPPLRKGGYTTELQKTIGKRFGRGRHVVDIVATCLSGEKILISLKWQQVSGTAEQKVPFELICLTEALNLSKGGYARAYIVLGGSGWAFKEFFVNGGLNPYLVQPSAVRIIDFNDFIALANQGKL